jgi:hypothetical protein
VRYYYAGVKDFIYAPPLLQHELVLCVKNVNPDPNLFVNVTPLAPTPASLRVSS